MRRLAVLFAVLAVAAATLVSTGAGGGEKYLVRAIFDNAGFVVTGEDVKVAGVKVGTISDIGVTEDSRAIVVLSIDDPAFQDFRRDATCRVRPASLIGEEYVDCAPTAKRRAGQQLPPPLDVIKDGDGKGQRLLPVENTGSSVDLDLINDTMRQPYRERLGLILGELGVGVAGRGEDLNAVIRRAAPALREVDGVVKILADQNRTLEQLAVDSDRIMAPLARERRHVSGFIEKAGNTAVATAERRQALEASIQRFPQFLRELRPTMARLDELATEMTPVVSDLGAQAPAINRLIRQLGPFSRAGIPALQTLGDVAEPGIPALNASRPIIADLRTLGREVQPVAKTLNSVLVSFQKNKGLEYLMDYVFLQAMAVNGFDTVGHYLRAALLVNVCSSYAVDPIGGCSSNFNQGTASATAAARVAAMPIDEVLRDTAAILRGADPKDVVTKRERRERSGKGSVKTVPVASPDRSSEAAPEAQAAPAPQAPAPASTPQPQLELMDYLFGGEAR
jgi:ABC-type transporter Mla subunit MlaD